jgi:hypothetical protein
MTYGKTRERERRLLNYERCLQWYAMFEKENLEENEDNTKKKSG